MPGDHIQAMILRAIEPPVTDWEHTGTGKVYDLLVGAAAALLQCQYLLTHQTKSSMPQPNLLNPNTLFRNVVAALDDNGVFNWWYSDPLSLWAANYCLNTAEANLAAALDNCVNVWIVIISKIKLDTLDRCINDEMELHSFIATRLRRIEREVPLPPDQVSRLLVALSEHSTWTALKAVEQMAANIDEKDIVLLSELAEVAVSDYSDEACTAIVFNCVNMFKHVAIPQRSTATQFIELTLSARALLCVSEFWKVMISHTKRPPVTEVV